MLLRGSDVIRELISRGIGDCYGFLNISFVWDYPLYIILGTTIGEQKKKEERKEKVKKKREKDEKDEKERNGNYIHQFS